MCVLSVTIHDDPTMLLVVPIDATCPKGKLKNKWKQKGRKSKQRIEINVQQKQTVKKTEQKTTTSELIKNK